MSLSCPYCVWLVDKEIELQLKWHCQGQAKTEWPIDSRPAQWPFHVTGRKHLPSSALSVSDTQCVKDLKAWTISSPTHFLLLDSREQSLSTRVSVAISAFFFLPFQRTLTRFSFALQVSNMTLSSSGQRIVSAGWSVKPPADWASYNLWLISADENCSIKVSVSIERDTQRQKGS